MVSCLWLLWSHMLTASATSLSCTFEDVGNPWCDWTVTGSWTQGTGATPTADTGPNAASEGSKYAFVEAGDGPNYAESTLMSPALSLAADADISFDYHMYGSKIGAFVLQTTTDSSGAGGWQATTFDLVADQGQFWQSATVTIPAGTARLRFLYAKRNGDQGDVGLDHVVFELPTSTTTSSMTTSSSTLSSTSSSTLSSTSSSTLSSTSTSSTASSTSSSVVTGTSTVTTSSSTTSIPVSGGTSVESSTPSVESSTPSVESSTPSVESSTPSVESSTPSVESSTPSVESSTPSVESSTPSASTSAEVFGCMTLSSFGGGGNMRALAAAYQQAVAQAAGVDVGSVTVEFRRGQICSTIDQSVRRLQDGEQVAMYFVIRFDAEEAATQARNILTASYPSEVSRILLATVNNDPSLGQVSVISDLVVGNVRPQDPLDSGSSMVWDGGRTAAIVVGALFLSCILLTAFVAYNKYKGKAAPKTEETAATAEVQEIPEPEGLHDADIRV